MDIRKDGELSSAIEITAQDCLREEATYYEKEVVNALSALEKVLQKATNYPEIMAYQKFWATLKANLLDLLGSVEDFLKQDTPIPKRPKLLLPGGGKKKLMLPPGCNDI